MIAEITANEVYLQDLDESEFSLEDPAGVDIEKNERKMFGYDDISGTGYIMKIIKPLELFTIKE